MSHLIVSGVPRGAPKKELEHAIRDTFLRATDDLSWLSPGDRVLLKPALNSPDTYPSTTHPLSVQVVARVLEERGARVTVGDQSGIGHVLHGPSGVVRGSSRENFSRSGMGGAPGLSFIGFEEDGWDGFYCCKPKEAASWPNGFWLTERAQEADHIINLPRLSTHAQAGVTLGFKNLVGLLREDSRVDFHLHGPFAGFMTGFIKETDIHVADDHRNAFFEKMVEIYLAVREKMRLTLITATQAQVTFGPDRRVVPFVTSHVVEPDTGLVFASADPVASEVFGIAFLTVLSAQISPLHKGMQKILMTLNGQARVLGEQSPWEHPFVKHALALGLGERLVEPEFISVPDSEDFWKRLGIG